MLVMLHSVIPGHVYSQTVHLKGLLSVLFMYIFKTSDNGGHILPRVSNKILLLFKYLKMVLFCNCQHFSLNRFATNI